MIVFARVIGPRLKQVAALEGVDCVGLDWGVDVAWAADEIQPHKTVQGNLDPLALMAGGDALAQGVDSIRRSLGRRPYVFNLGHGIQPSTPVSHVEQLVQLVRQA